MYNPYFFIPCLFDCLFHDEFHRRAVNGEEIHAAVQARHVNLVHLTSDAAGLQGLAKDVGDAVFICHL